MLASSGGAEEAVQDPLSRALDQQVPEAPEAVTDPLARKARAPTGPITLDFGSSTLSKDSQDSDEPEVDDAGLQTYASYGQLVGPPSYEESVLYDSVVNASNGPGGSASDATVAAKPALNVSVTDPQRREQSGVFGMQSGYMQYKVVTKSTLSSYKSPECVVRRRFREFVALDQLLKAKFRGYFIPPRPEKNAVEGQRMKDGFIEERRSSLEKYLCRLAAHPEIGPSEEMRLFLETEAELASDINWLMLQPPQQSFLEGAARLPKQLFGKEGVPQPAEVLQPAKKSADIMRMMREGMQGFKNELYALVDMPEDEKELRCQTKLLEMMWDQLSDTSRVAEKLVKKFERMGAVYGDLGLSFIKLSKYEEIEGSERARFTDTVSCARALSCDTKQCGIALVRLARLARKVTNKMAQDLGELHDYMYFMPSVQRALATREQAMLTLQTLQSQQVAKEKAVEDMEGGGERPVTGDRGKLRRMETMKSEIAGLESSVMAAKAEYEKIKAVNFQEVERFKAQKAADFTEMLCSLACVQAAYAERSAEVWASVARELGATEQQVAESRAGMPNRGIRCETGLMGR
ncbi:unnamed protein product [Ostreobium quekettii]|uniref:PX domain-containing protein n=1 Tax=Ostreobium quekettii TaxID=121088 RepID=A0A8S1J3C4_9CHLO|nr:unnamed protein product [Ostreobium quekettii]|eukprot:evm.model.scf_3165.1 EVM.evm.TU.scf_3165.1   scf_3165:5477-11554(+)